MVEKIYTVSRFAWIEFVDIWEKFRTNARDLDTPYFGGTSLHEPAH